MSIVRIKVSILMSLVSGLYSGEVAQLSLILSCPSFPFWYPLGDGETA